MRLPLLKMSNEKGFTLIEALIVLSIFILMFSISILTLKPQYYQLENQLFLSQLKSDIYYAQQHAMSTRKAVKVNFKPSRNYYYMIKSDGSYLLERQYSKEVTVVEASLGLYFTINPNGNLSKFGSIVVYIGDRKYRVTFLIGKGRFYVVREK